jgi:plastocyanin
MRHARWLLMVALVAGTACGGDGGDGGDGGGGTGTATDTVTMVDNAFEPSDPVVEAGSSLALPNDGQASHSFTIADEGIDEVVEAGGEASIEISLTAGEYGFDCSFHPEMTGTLMVQ